MKKRLKEPQNYQQNYVNLALPTTNFPLEIGKLWLFSPIDEFLSNLFLIDFTD
jgi:hypothetical protein